MFVGKSRAMLVARPEITQAFLAFRY